MTSHLRLVARIAMGYRGYGLPIGEVISEGNVGLMQAVKRFDPDKGFRLATYAMWWIRASIQEYILRSWSLVKMGTTAAQKKLFFNLRRHEGPDHRRWRRATCAPIRSRQIATKLGVPEDDVVSMNRRLARRCLAQRARARRQRGRRMAGLARRRHAEPGGRARRDARSSTSARAICRARSPSLNDRERRIFEARRLTDDPATLEDLSSEFGVSRERIRQIEVRAFEKVQKAVQNAAKVAEVH